MPAKAIREFDAKNILTRWFESHNEGNLLGDQRVLVSPEIENLETLPEIYPWLKTTKLVVKPDQLIKRRGKANLILLNANYEQVKQWILERRNKDITIEKTKGILTHFLIEPFLPHQSSAESYLCIISNRDGEEILFCAQGGVDVGNVDEKAKRLQVLVDEPPNQKAILEQLLTDIPSNDDKNRIAKFIHALFKCYRDLNFAYMEMNPIVLTPENIVPLDLAAKLDTAASFCCQSEWGEGLVLPPPFGRQSYPEELFIEELDSKTGASLKLTILNPKGRIWTMVAGGGASVVYADTICDLGFGHELANYGEYSGAPDCEATYQYAKTIFDLATREYDQRGKIIIIGGGIANFTDVAETFQGIIQAIKAFKDKLKEFNVQLWVRRGGPNYQEGLRLMKEVGKATNIDMHVYGPETRMTAVIPMALGLASSSEESIATDVSPTAGIEICNDSQKSKLNNDNKSNHKAANFDQAMGDVTIQDNHIVRFTKNTRCIVYGLQTTAVQGMLDFDYLCKRETPSVAALIFPFSPNHYLKFYWGTSERLIPVYQSIEEAIQQFPEVTVMINFASFRSVYSTTMEALKYNETIRTHAIIAEGVPESLTRMIIHEARKKKVGILGPATVGGIKPGCFRIGNSGGMIDNILHSKLYRPGSIAYVSKSGGMSNELNNILAKNADGVYEGVAIGGDKYPGSTFLDHLLRYQENPEVKMLVMLGEVGGTDEYAVCDALQRGLITKPLIAWCIGTCIKMFPYEVQFGHAGACSSGKQDTSNAKNEALSASGAIVPQSFDEFDKCIHETFKKLVNSGVIVTRPEEIAPTMPMDYNRAKSLGLVRKPANFISTISDDRGEELKYAGVPISEIFESNMGIGDVVSLLWFKQKFPPYAAKFIEMVLMVTADHGPAVAGAHNTIVTARAGKDLISSLVSGLLTIGPRFGGALDAAAKMFSDAVDSGITPREFVDKMRSEKKLIMGIGHRVKSITNPDARVTIIREYAEANFPSTTILRYALEVEKITTTKKANLILNVDGCIAVCFVDLLRSCGLFTIEEATEHLENGCLNGLFVLGRSIGFIGHFLDQKRLKQPLYRHPWDDISYLSGGN